MQRRPSGQRSQHEEVHAGTRLRRPLHETRAKARAGCEALRDAIARALPPHEAGNPAPARPGIVLIRLAELKPQMEMTLTGEHFEPAELETVIKLLAGPGMIQRLNFGGFVLLGPEVLSRYAAAMVRRLACEDEAVVLTTLSRRS
jgi:hypothetical protein